MPDEFNEVSRRLDEKIGYVQDLLCEKIDHLRSEVQGNDRRYSERFNAQEAASKYAQEKSNEFRQALDDVGRKQMPRSEAEALIKAAESRIDALQSRMDRTEGRSGGIGASWGFLVGAIGLAATVIAIVLALRR